MPDEVNKRYDIEIHEGVSDAELEAANAQGTVKNSRVIHTKGQSPGGVPIDVIRQNMRHWENEDVVPRPGDVFQERLYCIRWVETYIDDNGKAQTKRHYRAPTQMDLEREAQVLALLKARFSDWQEQGYIPSRYIEPGDEDR